MSDYQSKATSQVRKVISNQRAAWISAGGPIKLRSPIRSKAFDAMTVRKMPPSMAMIQGGQKEP